MKQLLMNSSGVVVARMPRPKVQPGQVLVRTEFSLVSTGTELAGMQPNTPEIQTPLGKVRKYSALGAMYLGKAIRHPDKAVRRLQRIASTQKYKFLSRFNTESSEESESVTEKISDLEDQGWNIGYSCSGRVIATGENVSGFAKGDLVACCGAGLANHAEYVCVPQNMVCKVPSGCSSQIAAMTTVGSIALQGIRRTAPALGERVAVIGLGLIGQMTVQLLKASGCLVVGMDLSRKRIERAFELGMQYGASENEEFQRIIEEVTDGVGVDKVVMTAATRSNVVINTAMEIVREKGTVVIVGDVGLDVTRQNFYRKEINLLMSTSYGAGRYDRSYEQLGNDYPIGHVRWTIKRNMQAFMEQVAAGAIDMMALVDRETVVDNAPEAYADCVNTEGEPPLGILIQYDAEGEDSSEMLFLGPTLKAQSPVKYALVGVGAFGTCMLVPKLAERSDCFALAGVVSSDTTRGGNYARQQRVEYFTTSVDAASSNPKIDMLVVATKHNQHAKAVLSALEHGKHIFVEKPLVTTWEDLDKVVGAYNQLNEKPHVMVGFNRRFSPALQKLKQVLGDRTTPLMINYRLNGGFIPSSHWIQTEEGAGRNVGEACHMYDVFRFLAGAPVNSVQAIAANMVEPKLKNDNFSAILGYEDGSQASLMYTSSGPKQGLAKERIEVFHDGEAWIVDDFKKLVRASTGEILWESSEPDKGHGIQLSQFAAAILGGTEDPVPFKEIVETTAVSLYIEDLIHGRDV